jgi:hypothetical protein
MSSVRDPDPKDPYVFWPPGSGSVDTWTDPDLDLSLTSKKIEKNLDFNWFCNFFMTCYL